MLDRANLLSSDQVETIRKSCDKLLTEHATPILVVTIDSIYDHYSGSFGIGAFAMRLFNQWQIGHATLNGSSWNTGILLLIAYEDRRARIELGAGWGHEKDDLCKQIMNERIVPMFKVGSYDQGILAGVEALDAMARTKPLPEIRTPPLSTRAWVIILGSVVIALLSAVSFALSGRKGYAWIAWGATFTALGWLALHMVRGNGGGSGFSGGSFGGGSSGGGGATGSW